MSSKNKGGIKLGMTSGAIIDVLEVNGSHEGKRKSHLGTKALCSRHCEVS